MSVYTQSMRWLLCLLVVIAFGCDKSANQGTSSTGSSSNEEGASTDASGGKAPGGGKPIVPIKRDVKSLEGNWVMVATTQQRDNYLWIVRLSRGADGRFAGEVLDTTQEKQNPELTETTVDGKSVHLVLKYGAATLDFQGTFDGLAVRGTVANSQQGLVLARLLSTDAASLKDYAETALPPGTDVFEKAIVGMKDQPDPRAILRIVRDHRTSPVSLGALTALVGMQGQRNFDEDTVREIMNEALEVAKIWGPRLSAQVELMCAQQLVLSRRLPTEALKYLDAAEKRLADESGDMKRQIAALRETAEIQVSLDKSRSQSESDRAAAHVELQDALKRQPYNAEILLALATHAETTKQLDDAISYYSDIVALPLLEATVLSQRAGKPPGDPTPADALKKLWIERHGNDRELEEHVAAVNREKLNGLVSEIHTNAAAPPAADAGDHTVLLELFTGGQCAPCVAADVAVTALSETFPKTEVITLRYHQHTAGPDSLVNQDGEDRFSFYEAGATPTVAVDGLVLDPHQIPYGGPLQFSPSAYAAIRQYVDLRRKQSTPIRLELEANVAGGELSVRAAVTGASDEELPSLRLRLALAEDIVNVRMPNGIWRHEMLVREMPGGARGISPKKGELKYSYTMPLADLQQHLDEYLSRYEAGKKFEFPAEVKPKVRGPLSLVGWVQNDKFVVPNVQNDKNAESRSVPLVLQTAIVPVSGWPAPQEGTAPSSASAPAPALPE